MGYYGCCTSLKKSSAYLNPGLKTQNVEKLSLALIFVDNFCQNIKRFCKQNCMLRIHSKPTEFTQNRTEIDKNV